jgi:hypothetical protein
LPVLWSPEAEIYCNNYLAALRALSHNRVTSPLIRTLDFSQR